VGVSQVVGAKNTTVPFSIEIIQEFWHEKLKSSRMSCLLPQVLISL
jgi:hypothetical protein